MGEEKTTIIIGCDHAAYSLKEKVKQYLIKNDIEVEDAGTHSKDSVDYPDFAIQVASQISSGKFKRGILICGTGIGMSMVANKFPHVRAALCNDLFSAKMSRAHNDANILTMGGSVMGDALALEVVNVWMNTPFGGGRHQTRLNKFDKIE